MEKANKCFSLQGRGAIKEVMTMTLTKAIKTLRFHLTNASIHKDQDTAKAIRIGIEAVKRAKECRNLDCPVGKGLLPGETEE